MDLVAPPPMDLVAPLTWHLTFFGHDDRLAVDIVITKEQARAILLSVGDRVAEAPPFGDLPVKAYLGASAPPPAD